jgi:hypothetical protein
LIKSARPTGDCSPALHKTQCGASVAKYAHNNIDKEFVRQQIFF